MQNYICATCGVQYTAGEEPPTHCLICEDERQYVGVGGQKWTTLAKLQADYHNIFKTEEPGLTGIGTHPQFAIGQRALLIQTSEGNVLWGSLSLVDAPTIAMVNSLGGIQAIAICHPHFYDSMVEWARAFDAPIYLHAADREWVMRRDEAVHHWLGDTRELFGGITLIKCGGHFKGSTVLHWPGGADGRGALLTGDTMLVTADRKYVTFMYSYPNLIPLSAATVREIVAAVEPFEYDRIWGGWWNRAIMQGAKAAVRRSAARYITAIGGAV